MPALLRRRGLATFALLVAVAEVTGRSLTARIDRALHVAPLANSHAAYYPFLLVALKVVTALALAALLARAVRARATADAGGRLLHAVGHRDHVRAPRLRATLSPRIWFASFAATSPSTSSRPTSKGPRPAAGRSSRRGCTPTRCRSSRRSPSSSRSRGASRAGSTTSRTSPNARSRTCGGFSPSLRGLGRARRPGDDAAPRRRFGLAFESRPPPLAC